MWRRNVPFRRGVPPIRTGGARPPRSDERTAIPVRILCKEFDLADSLVRAWMAKAGNEGLATGDRLSLAEREELERLRKENRLLRTEREILKRAATFVAKESA